MIINLKFKIFQLKTQVVVLHALAKADHLYRPTLMVEIPWTSVIVKEEGASYICSS
jgi:hypothetical protein